MTDEEILNNKKYYTCGRCKHEHTPDNKYPCVSCIYGTGYGADLRELKQQPCDDAVSRKCNNCAYYVNGANDEACDGCFEDVHEHPNFKPKAQHYNDAVSRRSVLDTLDKMDKALDDDRTVESYKALLTECYKDLPSVMSKERMSECEEEKSDNPLESFLGCMKNIYLQNKDEVNKVAKEMMLDKEK